ncbi:MAG: SxtJ family membrane protein [Thermoanaerobaculia bacterium]
MEKDRRFGLVVGSLFALLGGLLYFGKGRAVAGIVLGLPGVLLLLLAAAAPALLASPHRAWMKFAHVLGTANVFLFLSILYFFVLTPLGVVFRLFGRDELRRRGPLPASGWEPYPERSRDRAHFEKIF